MVSTIEFTEDVGVVEEVKRNEVGVGVAGGGVSVGGGGEIGTADGDGNMGGVLASWARSS